MEQLQPNTKSKKPARDNSAVAKTNMGSKNQKQKLAPGEAETYLDKYCPNWKNREDRDPESILMPSIFHCSKTFNVGDKKIEELKENQQNNQQPVCDRKAAIAEHIVYKAIQELVKDGIQKPFLAVHSLNMSPARNKLKTIFWKDNPTEWNKWENEFEVLKQADQSESEEKETYMGETDFIIIGPKIGFIIIEVKLGEKLGKSVVHGYKQLKNVGALISLIDLCFSGLMTTNRQHLETFVRKVLFVSELEKSQYDEEIITVDKDKIKTIQEAGNVINLFKENRLNSMADATKPELYTALRNILQTPILNANPTTSQIFENMYSNYAPVIACFKALVVSKSAHDRLDECDFSEMNMVLREYERLTKGQSHSLGEPKNQKQTVLPKMQTKSKKKKEEKVIFLSKDQQTALNGPYRQVIFGPPGTGKTIVLEAKCLELFRNNETVTVIAPKSYAWRYKILYDKRGFDAGQLKLIDCQPKMYLSKWFDLKNLFQTICSHPALILYSLLCIETLSSLINEYQENVQSQRTESEKLEFMLRLIDRTITNELTRNNALCALFSQIFEIIFGLENVIIDDGLEEFNAEFGKSQNYFYIINLIMAVAKKERPEKYVWIAADPYGESMHYIRKPMHDAVFTKLFEYQDHPNENFAVIRLTEVMRCCETIFEAAYKNSRMKWRPELEPTLGHWIVGCPISTIEGACTTMSEALLSIWNKIQRIIEATNRDGIDIKNVAIVVTKYGNSETNPVLYFLRERCQSLTNIRIGPLGGTITEEQLKSDQRLEIDETNVLTIEDWDKVSSLEWPIVLYVSCLPSNNLSVEKRKEIAYQRYRSISRGIIKVIEFQFTYEEPVKPQPIECNLD